MMMYQCQLSSDLLPYLRSRYLQRSRFDLNYLSISLYSVFYAWIFLFMDFVTIRELESETSPLV